MIMAIAQIAFYKGRKRLFNRLVSWWTQGPYSHCEFIETIDVDGMATCWSSSFSDGGIRRKKIKLTPEHWDIVRIEITEDKFCSIISWFKSHLMAGYDVIGLFGFIYAPTKNIPGKWFCSEAVAESLGFEESWRLSPNALYTVLRYIEKNKR